MTSQAVRTIPSGPALTEMTIEGATVAWTDTGTGEPVLLVHAGGFGAWFEPLAGLLPGRVIRMLRAGYTGGPPPPGPIDVAGHAAHAAALLDDLATGPTDVVAHSSGCVIALQLAADRPDLVRRLVLSEPPLIDPLLDPADVPEVGAALGPAMGAAMGAMAAGDVPAAFDAFMGAVCGPGYRAVLVDVLGPDGVARAEHDAAYFFADEIPAMGQWAPVDLAALGMPVLLVRGGASPGPTHRLVDRMAATLPDARVATVPDANHLLPLSHPGALAALVAGR
jgi:pimeloyl-ACP methyl ester carboxylesterase